MSDNQIGNLNLLGLGLSRLLRYSYGGFLSIFLASLLWPEGTKTLIGTLTPTFAAISALVIGAGIYVFHRNTVIPLHHLLLCAMLACFDRSSRRNSCSFKEILSPTGYLNKAFGVRAFRRILAYTTLRKVGFFPNERELNISHAENGLLVMTSVGCFAAGCFASGLKPWGHVLAFFLVSALSCVASYAMAWGQHAAECMVIKKPENRNKVTEILEAASMLAPAPAEAKPGHRQNPAATDSAK